MARRLPQFVFLANYPLDPDDINDASRGFVDELGGLLNEQNFRYAGITNISIGLNEIVNIKTSKVVSGAVGLDPTTPDNSMGFTDYQKWEFLDINIDITTSGGLLYVFSSLAVHIPQVSLNLGSKFALVLNGEILLETLQGSVEDSQDQAHYEFDTTTLPNPKDTVIYGISGPTLMNPYLAINLEWLQVLPAGTYNFKVAVLSVAKLVDPTDYQCIIGSREITAIEFTR